MTIQEPLQSTISERAYDRLRDDIVFARLAPGLRLRLDRLAADYGVGVSTLREILNRLASEGLVSAEDQRGFRVAPATAGDFEEVAAMRLLLESYALPLSLAAGDLEWEGRVVAARYKLGVLERRTLAGDAAAADLLLRYDRGFHEALIGACGSETLTDLYREVFDKYLRYQRVAQVFRGDIAIAEHDRLAERALARDAEGTVALLERHVGDCVAHTLATGGLT